MSQIAIEKGIPLPENLVHGRGKPPGPLMQAVRKMEVGDSVLVPRSLGAMSMAHKAAKAASRKVIIRSVENSMMRIWRSA